MNDIMTLIASSLLGIAVAIFTGAALARELPRRFLMVTGAVITALVWFLFACVVLGFPWG